MGCVAPRVLWMCFVFFSSRRRHTRLQGDWSSDVCSSDLRVSLMAQPELNIEVNLPSAWNGRLYMFGNGGWAGEAFDTAGRVASRAKGLKAGFVTAATDTGH